MWVEPELLHSGGDVALGAGKRVLGGAQALSAAPIGSSIFGDFDAARSFHQRLSEHRANRRRGHEGQPRNAERRRPRRAGSPEPSTRTPKTSHTSRMDPSSDTNTSELQA